MRAAYHEELASIRDGLVEMAHLAGSAMGRATSALLDADLQLAESVISADVTVDALQRDLEHRAIALLARQQPVATDLRLVVTSLRMSADLGAVVILPSTWPNWPGFAIPNMRCQAICGASFWRWASLRSV
jgi:phosphate uptake regulator